MTTPKEIVGGSTSIELEGEGFDTHGEGACSLAIPVIVVDPEWIPVGLFDIITFPHRFSQMELWEMIQFVCPEFKVLALICKIIENRDSQSTETGVLVTLLDPVIEIVIPILISRYSSVFSQIANYWNWTPPPVEVDYDVECSENREYDRGFW